MNIIYRKPTINDVWNIADIYVDCFSKSPYNKNLKKDDIIEEIKNDILEEDIYYVAEFDKKVIWISSASFFSFLWERKIWSKWLFILTKHQWNWIWYKLFSLVLEDWKKWWALSVEWTTHRIAPAFNFYIKNYWWVDTWFSLMEIKL